MLQGKKIGVKMGKSIALAPALGLETIEEVEEQLNAAALYCRLFNRRAQITYIVNNEERGMSVKDISISGSHLMIEGIEMIPLSGIISLYLI